MPAWFVRRRSARGCKTSTQLRSPTIPDARVVRIRDFLAVVAPREWDAVRALRALKASWSETATLPSFENLFEAVRATPVARTETLRSLGDATEALATAPQVFHASYQWPIQSHASMGPSCAVADIRDGGGTVWTASQGTHRLRKTMAKLLALDVAKLRLIYLDGSGSYGTNGNDDVAFEAALLSRRAGPPRARPMDARGRAWLGPEGAAAAAGFPRRARRGRRRRGMGDDRDAAGEHAEPAGIPLLAAVAAGLEADGGVSAGLMSLNSDPPYAIANMRAEIRWLEATPLRPSNLRAPGKIGNVFGVESFFDELAAAAGVDPLAYRLRQLRDPRGQEVLQRVGAMMAWKPRLEPIDRNAQTLEAAASPMSTTSRPKITWRWGSRRRSTARAAWSACCASPARTIAG